MGGRDKGLLALNGRAMIEHVLGALVPQAGALLINANRSIEEYARFGYPVIRDELEGFNGPLAGVASCMGVVKTPFMVTAPCDSPFVPGDLVTRLAEPFRQHGTEIAVAHNGERMQPVFAMLRTSLLDSLLAFLGEGERKIDRWFGRHDTVTVDFSDQPAAFLNVNSPDELADIEKRLAGGGNAGA